MINLNPTRTTMRIAGIQKRPAWTLDETELIKRNSVKVQGKARTVTQPSTVYDQFWEFPKDWRPPETRLVFFVDSGNEVANGWLEYAF